MSLAGAEQAQLVPNIGHLQDISICQTCAGLSGVTAIREGLWGPEQGPVYNGLLVQFDILIDIGYSV